MSTIIYGIITHQNNLGVQACAVLEDGTILDSHFCSSEGFAKSDLGFSMPLRQTEPFSSNEHSTVSFNKNTKTKYGEIFPDGYETKWLGFDHEIELKIDEWCEKQHERFK